MLTEPRSVERQLFRPAEVKRLFAEHRAKTRDHGNRIWRLLNLETWFRTCIEGDGEVPEQAGLVSNIASR